MIRIRTKKFSLILFFAISFSCFQKIYSQTNISGIINIYTPVTAINAVNCKSDIQVSSSAGFSINDKVLIIQMQGCIIDSSNTAAFGSITNYASSGNYEFGRINSITGNTITLTGLLQRTYSVNNAVQLIYVPEYVNATVSSTLTAQAWNGTTGGVLVFDVSQNLTLSADIDISQQGFIPGQSNYNGGYTCGSAAYFYPNSSILGVNKGEGIYKYSTNIARGRGAPANAGGGGNNHNTGGGGGSNYGAGGQGGNEWAGCNPVQSLGGKGGYALSYSNANNKIFMGGGGGAGHHNLNAVNSPGGRGGGIAIIKANTITGNGFNIIANAANAPVLVLSWEEGRGGGGGGGTVLLDVQNYSGNLNIEAKGGNGGTLNNTGAGPGGGGGGGVLWVSTASLPANVSSVLTGGTAGVTSLNSNYGSVNGSAGAILYNLSMPNGTNNVATLFLGNDTTFCGASFILNATTPNASSYLWQNNSTSPSYNVTTSGTYWVNVTVNGCVLSDTIQITLQQYSSVTQNISICNGNNYVLPNGGSVNISGTYIDTLISSNSCDSIITTNLNVLNSSSSTQNISICNGGNFILPGGNSVTVAGTYIDTLNSLNGCDSIITTNLTIVTSLTSTQNPIICSGQSFVLPDGSSVAIAGTYIDTLLSQGACDSIVTTNLSVLNSILISQNVSICQGDLHVLPGGNSVSTSGTYKDTLLSQAGCDSIITTNLSVNQSYSINQNVSICNGNSYLLPGGNSVSASGIYNDTLTSASGCDSVINTTIIVNPTYTINQNVGICIGSSYTLPGGSQVNTSGTYTDTLLGINGCDSTITTILTVAAFVTSTQNPVICIGQSFNLPDGSSANTTGTYIDTLIALGGCDSIVTTNLTVVNSFSLSQNATICTGGSYLLPGGNSVSTSGVYNDTLLSQGGCDSIITTNLSVTLNYNINQNVSICTGNSYTLPGGNIVSVTGNYIDTLITTEGCDSIINTTLTVSPTHTISQNISICTGDSYTLPGGSQINTAGTYHDTLTTTAGCDSAITTIVTVAPFLTASQNPIICSGNSFTLPDGSIVTTGGTYIDTLTAQGGCDSIITTNLVVNTSSSFNQNIIICNGSSFIRPGGIQAFVSGTYIDTIQNTKGCDSIITTSLVVNAPLIATIDPDASIIQGASIVINAGGGSTYNWNPSNGLSATTGNSVTASPSQTTTYCVEVIDNNGCKDTACITITVDEILCPPEENLQTPNAFSPNNDGVNDEYCLQGWNNCIKTFNVIILDRWGEKVFESEDPNFCWDGGFRKNAMEAQVFTYYIKATFYNLSKPVIKKGNISLLK